MASNPSDGDGDGDPPCNSETEEMTTAVRKKRLRRVSFADREITSIHIFNRDDDSSESKSPSSVADEVLGFFKDLADSDDSKEILTPGEADDDDDEVGKLRKSFLRPIESPSPGSSSIVGSATSNDEDNFFGPVSASFIRPGCLSDSGASDDNHDITMDSTAFSMHYRSLARSESENLKTPMNVHLAFEDKTPSQVTTPSDPGSFMVLTKDKKLVVASPPLVETSNGRDSNDMSLVGEKQRSYDYGKLSPELEALLAEGSKDLQAVSVSDSATLKSFKISQVSSYDKDGSGIGLKDCQNKEIGNVEGKPMDIMELDRASVSVDHQIKPSKLQGKVQTPTHLSKDDSNKTVIGTSTLDAGFPAINGESPSNANGKYLQFSSSVQYESRQLSPESWAKENVHNDGKIDHDIDQSSDKQYGSPLAGSVTSSSAKQQKIFWDAAKSYGQLSHVTPSPKKVGSFFNRKNVYSSKFLSSVLKSNSSFKIFEPSPLASSLKNGIQNTKLRLSKFSSSATSPIAAVVEENRKDDGGTCVSAPIINLEKVLFSVDLENRRDERKNFVDGDGIMFPKNINSLTKNEGTRTIGLPEDGDSLLQMPTFVISEENASDITTQEASPSQFTWSQKKVRQLALMPVKSTEGILAIPGSDSPLVEVKLDPGNNMKPTDAHDNFVSSSVKRLNQMLGSSSENRASLSVDLKEQVRIHECGGIGLGEDSNLIDNVTSDNHSTATTNELVSVFAERNQQSSASLLDSNHFEELAQVRRPAEKKISDLQHLSEPLTDLQTPSKVVGTGLLSPSSSFDRLDDSHMRLHNSQGQFPAQDIGNSSRRKRRNQEPIRGHADHDDKIASIKRSPKVPKNGASDLHLMLECSNKGDSERKMIGDDAAVKHWSDISVRLMEDTKQLLSPLIAKLHIREIDVLQDILVQLQKVKKYEVLCSQFQSQKICDEKSKVRYRRVAETRLLLYKLVYEKARLQVMSAKREKLLERAKQLSSAIQESHILKSNCTLHPSFIGGTDTPFNDNLQNSSAVNVDKKLEVSNENVVRMRHAFEDLDRKIKNLTNSLHSYCKMKGEPGCSEAIVLLHDHLKRRSLCRFIREDLQLWVVDDFGSTNGECNIVLNYQGLLCQRFILNTTPMPRIVISNKLNDINITKNCPNMDACVAFAYVLNAETNKKYLGFQSLAQETQITGLILRNLLDVIEEIQLAGIEIKNLVQTKFLRSSDEQLDLQVILVEFNRGRKVTMTLNVTCLRCGHYPLDIVPHQLQVSIAGTHKSPPESLSTEIKAAVAGLKVGYCRILRLCKCVDKVIQFSST